VLLPDRRETGIHDGNHREKRRQTIEVLRGHEREDSEWILKYLDLHKQRMAELMYSVLRNMNCATGMALGMRRRS
jgi:uncharacterized protein YpiB (UPF0302 family)